MKKALISPIEPVKTGYRVAQVEAAESIFPVADPLYWVDCDDEVVADTYWFDPADSTIKIVPERIPTPITPIGGAPNVIA